MALGRWSHLIDALEAEFVAPFRTPPGAPVSDAPEVLRISPSSWYLTGFLVPRDQGEIAGNDEEDEESSKPDPTVEILRLSAAVDTRTPAWAASWPLEGEEGVEERQRLALVVHVGSREQAPWSIFETGS